MAHLISNLQILVSHVKLYLTNTIKSNTLNHGGVHNFIWPQKFIIFYIKEKKLMFLLLGLYYFSCFFVFLHSKIHKLPIKNTILFAKINFHIFGGYISEDIHLILQISNLLLKDYLSLISKNA